MSTASRTVSFNNRQEQTGVGQSDWVILKKGGAGVVSIQIEASATAVVSIQGTLNLELSVGSDTVPAAQINDIEDMTALAANNVFSVQGPLKAVRINQTGGAGTSAITVLQAEGS